jgi:hypothetical protein
MHHWAENPGVPGCVEVSEVLSGLFPCDYPRSVMGRPLQECSSFSIDLGGQFACCWVHCLIKKILCGGSESGSGAEYVPSMYKAVLMTSMKKKMSCHFCDACKTSRDVGWY